MIGSQNRASNIKLLKFHENWDNQLILKNVIFNGGLFDKFETAIGFVALKPVWRWSRISISSPNWPHAQNETKIKLAIYILSRKVWFFFLQTTSNIGILYTVENYFSPWVWIQDRYLKIRLHLARIYWQSFSISHEKVYQQSRHFHRERKILLRRWGREKLVGTLKWWWVWPKTMVQRQKATAWPCELQALPMTWVDFHEIGFRPNGMVWSSSSGMCSTSCSGRRDHKDVVHWGERDRVI